MKKMILAVLLIGCAVVAKAENIVWTVGGVQFQLPNSGNDIEPLVGYDIRFKQGIGGLQTSFINIYNEVNLDLGGVGVWPAQTNGQPYAALSFDLKKHIPLLAQLSDLKMNVATRYNTDNGNPTVINNFGAIFSLAYSFGS